MLVTTNFLPCYKVFQRDTLQLSFHFTISSALLNLFSLLNKQ